MKRTDKHKTEAQTARELTSCCIGDCCITTKERAIIDRALFAYAETLEKQS